MFTRLSDSLAEFERVHYEAVIEVFNCQLSIGIISEPASLDMIGANVVATEAHRRFRQHLRAVYPALLIPDA